MPRLARLLLLVCCSSCATLNTAGMSENCRSMYNSCLDACPAAPRQGDPNPPLMGNDSNAFMSADCTQRCNDQAKKCK